MPKFIRLTLKYSFFSLMLYLVVIIAMGNSNPLRHNLYNRIGSYGHMFTRLKEAKNIRNVDILILGSSHSYRGFDTRAFNNAGFKTFNLGSSFQTPIQTKYLVDKYLDSLNPKLVILEASPAMFCDKGIESSLDILSNSKIDFKIFKLALKQNYLIIYNTLIYSLYRDLMFDEKNNFKESIIKGQDTYINGGYVEKEIDFNCYKRFDKQYWEFNKTQFEAFGEIIEIIKMRKIELMLVQAPIASALYHSYSNNDEFNKKISSFGHYHNFNTSIKLDDSLHFYDDNHLNTDGVKIFSNEVIKLLKSDI